MEKEIISRRFALVAKTPSGEFVERLDPLKLTRELRRAATFLRSTFPIDEQYSPVTVEITVEAIIRILPDDIENRESNITKKKEHIEIIEV